MPSTVHLRGATSVSSLSLQAQGGAAVSILPKRMTKMWAHSEAVVVRAWACDRRVEAYMRETVEKNL